MKRLVILFAAILLHTGAMASWYNDHIRKGSELFMCDILYPRWPESTYFACWNISMFPNGGYFYGGISGSTPSPQDSSTYHPGSVWSFWEHAAYNKKQVRNVYTHPYVYTTQYIGESASGSAGSPQLSFISSNRWYRMTIRTWIPDPSKDECMVGWWIKDIAANKWYHYGTFMIPYAATGFISNSGFLEDFGHGGRNPREIYRAAGYCMDKGNWYPCDTISINIAKDSKLSTQRWMVEHHDDGSYISMRHAQNFTTPRNLEPNMTHDIKIQQPATPTLDSISFSATAKRIGQDVIVRWQMGDISSPQLGYTIESFINSSCTGEPLNSYSELVPHFRAKDIKIDAKARYVKLTINDIFNQEHSEIIEIGKETEMKGEDIDISSLCKGVEYEYYETNESLLSVRSIDGKEPIRRGVVSEFNINVREDNESQFAITYNGLLHVDKSGVYTLSLMSCDGSELTIDGKVVADNDGIHGSSEILKIVALEEGFHPFKFTYFKNRSDENYITLALRWSRDGAPLTSLDKNLYHKRDRDIYEAGIEVKGNEDGTALVSCNTGNDKRCSGVVFYNGTKVLGKVTTAPFSFTMQPFEGENMISCRVYYDGDTETVDTKKVSYVARSTFNSDWNYATIGEEGLAHRLTYQDGQFSFVGEGEYMVYKSIEGDFELIGHLVDVENFDSYVQRENWLGLMVRPGTTMDTFREVGVFKTSASGMRSSADFSDYAATRMSSFRMSGDDKWLKITRRGNIFTTYSSADGVVWKEGLQRMFVSPEKLNVGITYLSTPGSSHSIFSGVIDNLSIKKLSTDEDVCNTNDDRSVQKRKSDIEGYSVINDSTIFIRRVAGCDMITAENGTYNSKRIKLPNGMNRVRSIVAHSDGILMLISEKRGGGLYKYDTTSNKMKLLKSDISIDFLEDVYGEVIAVDPADSSHILLASGNDLLESYDSGSSWNKLWSNDHSCISEISWNPMFDGMATILTYEKVSDLGSIWMTRDYGKNIALQIAVKGSDFRRVVYDKRVDNMFYINSTKGVYTSYTYCSALNRIMVDLPNKIPYFATDGVNFDLMRHFALPVDGSALYRSDVDHLYWQRVDADFDFGKVFDLKVNPKNKIDMTVYAEKGIFFSSDYGKTWSRLLSVK